MSIVRFASKVRFKTEAELKAYFQNFASQMATVFNREKTLDFAATANSGTAAEGIDYGNEVYSVPHALYPKLYLRAQ